jgi:DNA-binding transcriptional LysR family regulator
MRRIVVASPSYLARRGEPMSPKDIAAHDTIQFGVIAAAAEWQFVDAGEEIRVAHAPRFTTNIADAAIWHAEHGGGLTSVLAYQASDAIVGGRLKVVLADFQQPAMPIHIVYPTSRLLSAKVRAFIDLAAETTDWQFGAR